MESDNPKPVTSRPQLPAMPTTLMKKRFLYRSRFRTVTLEVKPSRFQRKPMYSRNTRLPAFGALGRMSEAGTSRRAEKLTNAAASVTQPTTAPMEPAAISVQYGVWKSGRRYMMA